MNDLNKTILTELLKRIEFWQPIKQNKILTGYKLELRRVYSELRLAKEVLFYDEVLFPRTKRIMRLIKFLNIIPEHVGWMDMEVGVNKVFTISYPCEIEWQEYISDRFSLYFDDIWQSDEWSEEPTEDEIMALGIRPESMMAIQEVLF